MLAAETTNPMLGRVQGGAQFLRTNCNPRLSKRGRRNLSKQVAPFLSSIYWGVTFCPGKSCPAPFLIRDRNWFDKLGRGVLADFFSESTHALPPQHSSQKRCVSFAEIIPRFVQHSMRTFWSGSASEIRRCSMATNLSILFREIQVSKFAIPN